MTHHPEMTKAMVVEHHRELERAAAARRLERLSRERSSAAAAPTTPTPAPAVAGTSGDGTTGDAAAQAAGAREGATAGNARVIAHDGGAGGDRTGEAGGRLAA